MHSNLHLLVPLSILAITACGQAGPAVDPLEIEHDETSPYFDPANRVQDEQPAAPELPDMVIDPADYPELSVPFPSSTLGVDMEIPGEDWEHDGVGTVEKSMTTVGHGWALNGHVEVLQDGFEHWVPNDTNFTSRDDFALGDLAGRCGRFDSTLDVSWLPCAQPRLRKGVANGKRWTWRIVWPTFEAAGVSVAVWGTFRTIFENAITDAVNRVEEQTDIDFFKGDAAFEQNINIVYDNMAGVSATAVAISPVQGQISMSYAAANASLDHCETPSASGNIAGWEDLHIYSFTDVIYTYNKFNIGVEFFRLMNWATTCNPTTSQIRSRVKSIMMHELGHGFGFSHEQLPGVEYGASSNSIMTKAGMNCTWALNHTGWNNEMRDTVNVADTHVLGLPDPIQITDNDISCHSPLGGNEGGGTVQGSPAAQ
jgi:hypothetical protein